MVRYIVLQALYKPKESSLKKDYYGNDKEKDSKFKGKEDTNGKKGQSQGSGVQHLEVDDLMSNDPKMVSKSNCNIYFIDVTVRLR